MISVKAVQLLPVAVPPYIESKSTTYASTISSDGFIRLFDMADVTQALSSTEKPVAIESVTSYDTKGSRLTCLAMADDELVADASNAGGKRKRDEDELDGEDASEDEEEQDEEGEDEDEREDEDESE